MFSTPPAVSVAETAIIWRDSSGSNCSEALRLREQSTTSLQRAHHERGTKSWLPIQAAVSDEFRVRRHRATKGGYCTGFLPRPGDRTMIRAAAVGLSPSQT